MVIGKPEIIAFIDGMSLLHVWKISYFFSLDLGLKSDLWVCQHGVANENFM